jgi:hypothetical protein
MRPFRMPAIALTILAWAVFAGSASAAPSSGGGGGAVITFSRAAAASSGDRVWYVVSGERAPAGVDDEPPADDESVDPDEDSGVGDEWLDGYTLPSSLPESEYELMGILQGAGLVSGGTYRSALKQLELPFLFAGREQWVLNVSGVGVEDDPRLWDVSMQSVVSDPNAQRLLLGRTIASAEARGPQAAFDDLGYWETLVPTWAPRVRDALAEQGIPFSVELLSSPEMNLTDPSKPLFAKGDAPQSLLPLGVLQAGENAFLRSLSAEELMLEVWPAYWRYAHRPAGAPVPDDLRAGMTFGSPVLLSDGTYLRSPMMTSDAYTRWRLYGYPGDTVDKDAPSIADWNPTGYSQLWALNDELEAYAPWNLDEATLSRYDLLLHGK